jgi:hypothetical protein
MKTPVKWKISRFIQAFLMTVMSCQWMVTYATANDIPSLYHALYLELDSHLTRTENTTKSRKETFGQTTYAIELLVADGQRGEILLSNRVRAATILTLDRIKVLGVTGVSFSIPYPLLSARFNRYEEYRIFYRDMITEAKKRGFKVMVEFGAVFPEPEFSLIRYDYSKETPQTIEEGLTEMARVILSYAPDYLSLPSEPDTFTRNVGIAMDDKKWTSMIQRISDALTRSQTKIGAGAGTWSPLSVFQQLTAIKELDYLDIHIYPIQRDYFAPRVSQIAALTNQYKKGLVVGEAWLYKVSEAELGTSIAGSPGAFARDTYSFWEPLDARFIKSMVALSRAYQIEYCSFFWMRNFFAYLDYNRVVRETPGSLFEAINAKASANIINGTPNHLGRVLYETIRKEGQ